LRGKTPDGEKVDKGFRCAPIARKRISAISTDDVLAIVRPLWTGGQFPTADKLRGRLENVFGYAITKGHLPSDAANPAQWRGRLEFLLPSRKAMHRETNHAMVEWRDAPALLAAIRAREGICYRALQLLALTALRAGDARSLRAGDIDFGSMTLRIQKTKTGEPHDVPMAPAVADLLRPLIEGQTPGYRPFDVGEASLRQALARLPEAEGVTVHGWRACFRSWCAAKGVDDEAAESALAHKPRGIVSVYQREKMVERRRPVMEAWARHLNGNVTSLRAA
jgi:integrase